MEVPEEVLWFMKRTLNLEAAGGQSPFNRRLRRRWEKGKGVILHLFSGRDGRNGDPHRVGDTMW